MKTFSFALFFLSLPFLSTIYNPINLGEQLQAISFYKQGLEKARLENKPVFLLFTGEFCPNNKKIRSLINENEALQQRLATEFVNVWLFIDNPAPLPKPEAAFRKGKQVVHKTYGNKWATLEINTFDRNIAPLAVIINSDGKIMNAPKTYDELKNSLDEFVSDGLNAFIKNQ